MDSVDVDIDVENLFNDGNLDQILPPTDALPLQPPPLVPGLSEHFLNSQFSGGINRVSWSRLGSIAIISLDGSTVSLYCLRSNGKKEWKLSEGRPIEVSFENAVNLAWSPSGFDLAIVDSQGRVGVFTITTPCLNQVVETKSYSADTPTTDLGMPAGTWWFNQDRQDRPRNVIISSTRGDGEKWVHNPAKAKALGPLYIRAFCMVNRRGVFTMMYYRSGARYHRASMPLPFISDTVCSHAAFSPTTEGKILVVVHTVKGDLSAFHISITWPPDVLTDSNSNSQPTLVVETIDNRASLWLDSDDITNNTVAQGYKPDNMVLTHLAIVPTSDIESADQESPAVWTVYTSTNPAMNATDVGYLTASTIRRWRICPTLYSLNPRFKDIPVKTEMSTDHDDVPSMERMSDIVLAQVVTSIELVEGGQMVAISTADGRTEFWNPITQALVSFEGQPNEVTSLPQFGFSFNPAVNAVTAFLSPNACATLSLTAELKPSLQYLQHPMQSTSQGLDLSDPHQSASVAALILAFARSCWSTASGDDVLSCIISNYTPQQYPAIISEIYRTLFRETEFIHEKAPGSEAERLSTKPLTAKVLSLQLALFNSGSVSISSSDEDVRFAALSGVWAWLSINLRYITSTLYLFFREYQASLQSHQNASQPTPQMTPIYVEAICSTVRWALDLFRFILATILEIGDRQSNPNFFSPVSFSNNIGDALGDGSQGLVALLLNCQWSRSFLAAAARAMRVFVESNEKGPHPAMARVVNTIRQHSVNKGMNMSAIDRILDQRIYIRNGLGEGEIMDPSVITKRQIAMCSSGRVGPEFSGTLRMLLEKVINDPQNGLRAKGDIQRLKLWSENIDLNWLLLGLDHQFSSSMDSTLDTLEGENVPRRFYDVHRKSMIVVLGGTDQLIRRCARCGSLSGDVDAADKSMGKNMIGHFARCVCDSYWVLEPLVEEITG